MSKETRITVSTPVGSFLIDKHEKENFLTNYKVIFEKLVTNLKGFNDRISTIVFDYDKKYGGYIIMAYTKRGTLFVEGETFADDHSNDLSVTFSFIDAWNKLPEIESEKEQYSGVFEGMKITFNREWGGYKFTDEECEKLLAGEYIIITPIGDDGEEYEKVGKLGQGDFGGFRYYGFIPTDPKTSPIKLFYNNFSGHKFTKEEKTKLLKGEELILNGVISQKTGKPFNAKLKFNRKDGLKVEFLK